MNLLVFIRRQIWPLFLFPLLLIASGLVFLVFATPRFESSAFILVDAHEVRDQTQLNAVISSYVETADSDDMTANVIDRLALGTEYHADRGRLVQLIGTVREELGLTAQEPVSDDEKRTLLVKRVKKDLKVGRVRETTIIRISFRSASPQRAADIATEYAKAFIAAHAEQKRQLSERKIGFVLNRIENLRSSVDASYQQARSPGPATRQDTGGLQDMDARISQMAMALSELDGTLAGISERVRVLKTTGDLASLEAAALQVERGPSLFRAYAEAYKNLPQRSETTTPQQGATTQIEGTVERLGAELDRVLKQALLVLEQERKIILARRDSIAADLREALELVASHDWLRMQRAKYEATVFETLYAESLKELEAMRKSAIDLPVSLMTSAHPDPNPVWPNYKVLLLLSAFGGLGLGAAIAVFREWHSEARYRDPTEVGSILTVLEARHSEVWETQKDSGRNLAS